MAADTQRHPLVQQNVLDKAIAYFAPGIARARMQERAMIAMAGGYTGARTDRAALQRWRPGGGSPTSDAIADLPMLRERSRDQMRNAPVAVGALNTTVSHVVGTGLTYTPAIDGEFLGLTEDQVRNWSADVKRRFAAWAESLDCDYSRNLNFYGLQELGFRTVLESGDALVVTPRVAREAGPAKLALQLIEGDRICNPRRTADTRTLIEGVELSLETNEAVAFHVARNHPGDIRAEPNTWDRIAARGERTGRRNCLHLFKPLRPGQVRGIPWIAPILEPLKQLSRYTDAELKAAVDSAIFSVFVKMDPEAFQSIFDDEEQAELLKRADQRSTSLESGKAVNLLPGEEIQSNTPGRPNPQFDPFVMAILRQIGMALELPYEVLVMHYQSSYSAARAALLTAWKFFRARRDWLATYLCQPVFELWLADEVAEGRVAAPGFFRSDIVRAAWCKASWIGDGPGSIDPQKEVAAAEKRVALGISTKQAESILHDGIDWETKHRQRVKETQAERRDGLAAAAPQAQQPGVAEDPVDPSDIDKGVT